MDGMTEQANRSIGQVLQAMVRNDQKDWEQLCPMVDFALNSSVSMMTGYAPFELNCRCITLLGQHISTDTKYAGVKQFTQQALYNLMVAHNTIIESCMVQTHHANNQQCQGEEYPPGSMVYLSTKNLALPKGQVKKLLPRYIGPYRVVRLETHTAALTVMLELPPELVSRWMHLTFHVSLIQAHVANDDERFPCHDMQLYYGFGPTDEHEWFVDEILAHQWVNEKDLEFQVCWTLGDVTWEPKSSCKDLEALDAYLELCGATWPHDLLCKA